ncbi:hypothetical protein PRIPAC_89744 [Pristionchus pacificus]|uniref:Methyltransferase n=1 Tax=Pristionchus pacificus TaxID=54126 RepID=A0A2A6CTT8_PRIPA|nr:hypothetical protein PRIPAC_89744 [Pristionchus pacificus]|eukprot:PDM81520.1 methyltransferase [Pristionchus pacificus]
MLLKALNMITDKIYTTFVSYCIVPLITKFLKPMVDGTSEQILVDLPSINKCFTFGGQKKLTANNNETESVTLRIDQPVHFCWSLLLDQKIGLGESYMHGDWCARPGIKAFLTALIRAKREKSARSRSSTSSTSSSSTAPVTPRNPSLPTVLLASIGSRLLTTFRSLVAFYNYCHHRVRDNTILRSRKNIEEHYDLGNDMFNLFLDDTMTYSCALFDEADLGKSILTPVDFPHLRAAQLRKIDALLETLNLGPNDHVLEIGCGWGAAAIRAVQRFGCRWTGLTISTEQLEMAQERVREAGLEASIDLKLLDYRLETARYSAVVSIEMIEAVGEKFLPEYFQVIYDRLEEGGKAAIQAIICPDAYYDRYCRSSDFIKKHIFPGGHMPSVGAIQKSLPRSSSDDSALFAFNIERSMAQHYSHTLDVWLAAWLDRERDITTLGYSSTFHRKWQFYFGLCSALFNYDHIDVIQFTLTK